MNTTLVAEALRALANALETPAATPQPAPAQPAAPTEAPVKRGRGRPVKGEEATPAAPVPSQAVAESDPFAAVTTVTVATPVATLDEVRKALTELKAASSQDIALGVLKASGGADNLTALTADKYGQVVWAARVKQAEYMKAALPAPTPEPADPFAMPTEAVAPAAKPLTIEDVKAVIVEAQKRTATDTVQKIVMAAGGVGANAETGAKAPSLKALPVEQYAAVIAAIKNLPKTK